MHTARICAWLLAFARMYDAISTEEANSTSTTITIPQVKRCPDAWSQFEDTCYWVIQDNHSWLWARALCQKRGADLGTLQKSKT